MEARLETEKKYMAEQQKVNMDRSEGSARTRCLPSLCHTADTCHLTRREVYSTTMTTVERTPTERLHFSPDKENKAAKKGSRKTPFQRRGRNT